MVWTFSHGQLFSVSIFYKLTSGKNHCLFSDVLKTTLVICPIVGKPYNWLNSIWSKTWKVLDEINPLWSFFNRVVKFIVSLLSLSSVHLYICFLNSLKYSVTKKCEGLIKCHSHDRCYVFSFTHAECCLNVSLQ